MTGNGHIDQGNESENVSDIYHDYCHAEHAAKFDHNRACRVCGYGDYRATSCGSVRHAVNPNRNGNDHGMETEDDALVVVHRERRDLHNMRLEPLGAVLVWWKCQLGARQKWKMMNNHNLLL